MHGIHRTSVVTFRLGHDMVQVLIAGFGISSDQYRTVRVGFVEDEVSLGQVTVRIIRFSPIIIIPPKPNTHLRVHVSVIGRTGGRNLGKFKPL